MAASVKLLITLLVAYVPTFLHAHGRVLLPASRMSAYLVGFQTPVNYNDHEMNCGGRGNKCNICGEKLGESRYLRPNGSMVQHNILTGVYTENEILTVGVQITVAHKGRHEFRLCDVSTSGGVEATQECLNGHLLADENGVTQFTYGTTERGDYEFNLVLPENLTCSHCVLQWYWKCGNDWGCNPPPNYGCCIGCGDLQEEFYACSDIMIKPRSGSFNITQSPLPTAKTATTTTTTTTAPSTSTITSTTISTISSTTTGTRTTSSQPLGENTTPTRHVPSTQVPSTVATTTKIPTTQLPTTKAPSTEAPIKLSDNAQSFLQYFQKNPNITTNSNSSSSIIFAKPATSSKVSDEILYNLIKGPDSTATNQNGVTKPLPMDEHAKNRMCAACKYGGFKEPQKIPECADCFRS